MKIVNTKPIFNIFSKKTEKPKVETEKQKVIADYREKSSLVASELISLGIEVEFRELKVADYLVNNVAIERKTISDFISSMINQRIKRQLEEIQQYEKKFLIIEGIDEQELYSDDSTEGVSANAIRGFLLSIILKFRIPVIFTKNFEDTARFINVLARKKEKESSLNVSKKTLNKKERMQFILEAFPGVGPKTAKKLLEEFKTIKNIMNASAENLEKAIGKKAEVFRIVGEDY
ncbi:MAG: helix-hairpin-helix domain-containing protein [Candidatus Pacearchaeota archaeon]|nr:helix-hairpin-helix domain-containing protein [Candidatus Pacearchaeota archaeon]